MSKTKVGRAYEQWAQGVYERAGYRIVAQNYRYRGGEVDFIAQKDECLVFVEVRYRAKNAMVSAVESVTSAKRRRIYRGVRSYQQKTNTWNHQVRVDLVAIDENHVRRYEITMPQGFSW